ncbi:nucleolar protein 14-like [Clytia hemisphaerica]|uniref:Nucleolar protein 14 n=1 Tax=Clytia hemisphaerica TaxID=252671 RepID=A0A7M5WRD5_9CNID
MAKKNKNLSSDVEARRKKKRSGGEVKRNPFEVRINRLKHDVIGQKVKTDKGMPGISRSKANEKRKKTLLKEYKQRFKNNAIIDRRFGEFDESLSIEDKMLKRFAMEKQSHHERSDIYRLHDDDEDDILTHMGQNLGDIDNFDDAGLQLTDNEDDNDASQNFGGFLSKKKKITDEEQDNMINQMSNKKMTKQEIMDEIVANSKKKKMERQQTQEKAFELTQKLDSELKDIMPLLAKQQVKQRDRIPADDYDRTVNELFFETKKAKATDRMKTEGEKAQEEKQLLEKLEKERRMRMLGITLDSDDDMTESADALITKKKNKSDDRLEVYFRDGKMVLPGKDEDGDSGTGGEEESESEEEEGDSTVESGEEDEGDSDHEDIFSDEDMQGSGDDSLADDEKSSKKKNKKKRKKSKEIEEAINELPYVFDAPNNLTAFLKIVGDRSEEDILTVCQRIKKCHHIKLDVKNITKMQTLFDVMLDYIEHLCNDPKPRLKLINNLTEFLTELFTDVQKHANKTMLSKIKNLFKKINQRVQRKGGQTRIFPSLSELTLLRLVCVLYPTSDLNHVITTPALVLIAMILAKGHFRDIKDVVSGLYLLQITYNYVKEAKRYLPEVIAFLSKLLFLAAPVNASIDKLSASVLNLRKEEKNLILVKTKMKKKPQAINLVECLSIKQDEVSSAMDSDRFKLSCVWNVLQMTKKFSKLYVDLSSYNEVFTPCLSLLERIPKEKFNKTTKALYDEVALLLKSQQDKPKIALTMQARKPKPLPLLEPQFDENYEVKPKRKAGDKAQNEAKKLKYKLKKETKGAIREIRKDAQFLAKEQLKEKQHKDNIRKQKVKDLQKQIDNERQEIKEMEKGR